MDEQAHRTYCLKESELFQAPLLPYYDELFLDLGSKFITSLKTMAKCSQQSSLLFSLLKEKLHSAIEHINCPALSANVLDCSYCEGFMAQPVCLPCGHSMCKSCVGKASKLCSAVCPKCEATISTNDVSRKPTVVVRNILKKYYPKWVESCEHREVGNTFANEGDFPIAIDWYNKAIESGVEDHRVYGNRSRSYLAINEADKALSDAKVACTLRPLWKKGHFRRARALEKVGKWMEATAAYLLCHYLSNGKDQAIKTKVCQLLDEHMSDFTHYERHLSSSSQPTSGLKLNKSGCSESLSLTPTIDRVIGLSANGLSMAKDSKTSKDSVTMDIGSFTCSLCMGLMYEPLTVACGHSFCRSCGIRAFDHSQTCPVCRAILYEFFWAYSRNLGVVNVDETLRRIISEYFPKQYLEKKTLKEAESLRNFRVGTCETEPIPIFVCTQTLPGIHCPLYVFEPRYRLLIRRCVETGSRRFGMCQPEDADGNESSFSDFGTVLYINSVEYTPDGRSLVKTVGERRFKVVGRDMVDGYHRARVQFIFDERVSEQSEIDSLRALQSQVYAFAKKWLDALPTPVKDLMMQSACSPLPPIEKIPEVCPNGPMWLWWYIHTLPLSSQLKQDMFTCTSLRERLLKLNEALPVGQIT